MGKLEQFKIDLKSLTSDVTDFDFSIGDDYFAAIEGREVNAVCLCVHLTIKKSAEVFDLRFHIEGTVTVTCDLCLDDMSLPIETDNRLVVSMGDSYREDDDHIVVPAEEGILNVAWLIYEMIALSIPIRHVHEEGGCNQQMLARLNELSVSGSRDDESKEETDPRWKELEKLKTIFKD